MPGTLHTKRENGLVFPPDWTEIGYSNTPESTLEGFNYAKEIDENWDTSVHTYTEAFREDYKLMYFPNMSYEKRYSMERCSRMFQGSNLEYFNSSLPYVQELASTFASCHNLRYCKITDLENTGINSISGLFTDCFQLERVDINFDTLPSSVTNISNIFSSCWNFKEVSINNDYIVNAGGAFQNTYSLESANIKLKACNDISFYASGKDTTNGLSIDLNIGQTATQGVHFTFEKAKISCNGSEIIVKNCNTMQSAFRNAVLNMVGEGSTLTLHITDYNNSGVNCSFAFQNATFIDQPLILFSINKINNAISMFDGATFSNGTEYINLQTTDFSLCTNLSKAFANSNISELNKIEEKVFSNCTNFENMFQNSPNLIDDTINGLLLALTTATSYSGTKTLSHLGFNSTDYPANRIQALSNYSAFTSAGWSIGY